MGESEEKAKKKYAPGAGKVKKTETENMLRCEVHVEKIYLTDPSNPKSKKIKEMVWEEVAIKDLATAKERHPARCLYCHGKVKIHFAHKENGIIDHCEHSTKADSTGCKMGHYYDGMGHRLSKHPLV